MYFIRKFCVTQQGRIRTGPVYHLGKDGLPTFLDRRMKNGFHSESLAAAEVVLRHLAIIAPHIPLMLVNEKAPWITG